MPRQVPPLTPAVPVLGSADEDGLVRAIWADPFDDAPRLIYSDWLEEQGKPLHAAFLRTTPDQRSAFAGRLSSRMREDAPCQVTPVVTADGLVRVAIHVRSLRSKAFEAQGPAWLRRHHVAEVWPDGTPGDWASVFAAGWLAHARGLSFEGRNFDGLAALAASPQLATLASIHLGSPKRWWEENLAAFFRESNLRGLCRILRPALYLTVDAVQAMGEAPFVANLRHLQVGVVRDEALTYLTESPKLAGLVTLSLIVDGVRGVKTLADAPGLDSVRNLDLSRVYCTDVGMDALGGSPLVARLRRLRITVGQHSLPVLERLARTIAPHGLLVVAKTIEERQREALAGILGERLVLA